MALGRAGQKAAGRISGCWLDPLPPPRLSEPLPMVAVGIAVVEGIDETGGTGAVVGVAGAMGAVAVGTPRRWTQRAESINRILCCEDLWAASSPETARKKNEDRTGGKGAVKQKQRNRSPAVGPTMDQGDRLC